MLERIETDHPAIDMCLYRGSLVVSTYDSYLNIYKEGVFTSKQKMPAVVNTLFPYGDRILCGSISGAIYVLDTDFKIVSTIKSVAGVLSIGILEKTLFSVDIQNSISVYSQTKNESRTSSVSTGSETESYSRLEVYMTEKEIDVVDFGKEHFVLGCGCKIIVLGFYLNTVFEKVFSCNVSSVKLASSGVFVGFFNGKVHFENFQDPDCTFTYNSHYCAEKDTRIYYPVTYLEYADGFLYSSGSDGKIIKWSIENKKKVNTLFNINKNIKKFIIKEKTVYAIVEGLEKGDFGSLFRHTH